MDYSSLSSYVTCSSSLRLDSFVTALDVPITTNKQITTCKIKITFYKNVLHTRNNLRCKVFNMKYGYRIFTHRVGRVDSIQVWDASQHGLGAALIQNDLPIHYASHAFTCFSDTDIYIWTTPQSAHATCSSSIRLDSFVTALDVPISTNKQITTCIYHTC